MNAENDQLPAIVLAEASAVVPAVIAARGQHAGRRFIEFFTANIRNPNMRKAYYRAASEFSNWCDDAGLRQLDIEPVHVAAWVETLGHGFSPPTVKQSLAAVRMLFDWLVVGQIPVNPAAACAAQNTLCGSVRLQSSLRPRLDNSSSLNSTTVVGLRDRALIGLLVFTFARIGARLG